MTWAKTLTDAACSDVGRLVLAILLVVGTFVLLFTGKPVPDFILPLDGAAIGFYFGGLGSR